MDTTNHTPGMGGLSEGGSGFRHPTQNDSTDDRGTTYWDAKKGPGPRVLAASTLKGDNVVNLQNEKVGDITEIMIDVPTGRVAYAVLSVGGFLGIGDKLFAIPWSALGLDAPNKRLVLDVSKERLKDAPGFDKDNWPAMADEAWATRLHDYYGAAYYWR